MLHVPQLPGRNGFCVSKGTVPLDASETSTMTGFPCLWNCNKNLVKEASHSLRVVTALIIEAPEPTL